MYDTYTGMKSKCEALYQSYSLTFGLDKAIPRLKYFPTITIFYNTQKTKSKFIS